MLVGPEDWCVVMFVRYDPSTSIVVAGIASMFMALVN